MEPNTTPQQIPTQQVAPLKQNVSIALAFLVFVLIGVASYFGYQNYQLKQQISQIELSRVSPASASPTVSPSPTIVKTADQKEVKVNRGSAVVAYEPPLSNQEYVSERNTIEQKIVAPFLDYWRDTEGDGYVVSLLLSIQKNENIKTQYPYQLIAINKTGGQIYESLMQTADELNWWIPTCQECVFTENFRNKYPEIIKRAE